MKPSEPWFTRNAPIIAVLFGFLGVALGAFGAHGLKDTVSPSMLEVWKTAVNYQMYHVPIILLLGFLKEGLLPKYRDAALVLFTIGIIVFSGSLYILVLTGISALGMITPLGGLSLLAAWLSLLIALMAKR